MRHAVIKTNVKNAGNIATWYRRLCAQTCYISEFVRVFVQVTYLAGGAGSVRGGESTMEEGKCRTLAIRAGVCTQVRQVHLSYLVQVGLCGDRAAVMFNGRPGQATRMLAYCA